MQWERKARRTFVLNYARDLARCGRYADWEAVQADTRAFADLTAAESPSGEFMRELRLLRSGAA